MKVKQYRTFVGDFETTVFQGQTYTEVWASALVELYKDEVTICGSIDEQFQQFLDLKSNLIVYYHNLKFDGGFWLPFLIQKLKLKHAFEHVDPTDERKVKWLEDKHMPNNSFKYSISEMGQWYNIIIKVNNRYIEIRDSYKLLPFSVKRMGKSFKTKHQKLDMEYEGFRYANCEITEEEKHYIKNDVLVVKECIEIMYNQGHNKLTIGSCCLAEYKKTVGDKSEWEMYFPEMKEFTLDKNVFGWSTAEDYIRRSYRGGWCYVVEGKEKRIWRNGSTADVNSLYPSVMHSESGNRYPVGKPTFWKGNYIPDDALKKNRVYFIRIKTRFYLKENMLPFVQIKKSFLYKGSEMLKTSDIKDKATGEYFRFYIDSDGNTQDSSVILTLTMMDYELMKKHYELVDFEILDGCWFYSEIGIFDDYINHYREIKMSSEGAVRESAKLFLNNLYGKMASSDDSSFKVAYEKEDGTISYYLVTAHDKETGFIPVGSFTTSYARIFTINVAQQNYHGLYKDGFVYADTDSLHCSFPSSEIKGINVDDNAFCCWSIESEWDYGFFNRPKTYIEHIVRESKKGKLVDVEPFHLVKCAGMPDSCKELFIHSLEGTYPKDDSKYTDEQKEFMIQQRTVEDFDIGLRIFGKLVPKRIKGGILLTPDYYTMRE